MPNLEPCPLWGGGRVLEYVGDALRVDNDRAGGSYEITGSAAAVLKNKRTDKLAAKLTTWIVDQHRSGVARPIIDTDILRAVEVRPRFGIAQQMARFFEMLAYLDVRADFALKIAGTLDEKYHRDRNLMMSWLGCEDERELSGLTTLLIKADLVETRMTDSMRLTPEGVNRLTETQTKGVASRQAFIAMWFHPSMDDATKNGFEFGITAAGYTPMRIDKKEHSNKIDDEIVAEIRKSKFVVADFTSELTGDGAQKTAIARGGVYFEAGFALGLGLPVIWCCRADLLDHVHFDTRQFAHVVWTTPQDLAEKLYHRICAVIGPTSDSNGDLIF